jgi:hypothetical protein
VTAGGSSALMLLALAFTSYAPCCSDRRAGRPGLDDSDDPDDPDDPDHDDSESTQALLRLVDSATCCGGNCPT